MKPLVARLRHEFNVSVAEVEAHDQLGHAVLAVAAVSPSPDYVHGLLTRVARVRRRVAAGCRASSTIRLSCFDARSAITAKTHTKSGARINQITRDR